MDVIILVVHVLAAASIIGLVLVQHGKGADVGAAFGSGSAGSVFGSSGSANFLSRMTAVMALVFFLTSIGLSYLASKKSSGKGVMANQPAVTQPVLEKVPSKSGVPDVPAAPAAAAPAAADAPKADAAAKPEQAPPEQTKK